MSLIKMKQPNKHIEASGFEVIERLEEALAMAKDGLVSNVIVLAVLNDGGVMDCWANNNSPFVMVGGLESIKKEFMDSCIEGR